MVVTIRAGNLVPLKEFKLNINISYQVLAGNLGDGWADQNVAADALAEFTRARWTADLADFKAAGHSIEIVIDVAHNTVGCGRDLRVVVINEYGDYDIALEAEVILALTSTDVMWELFCGSPEAEALI